MIDPYEKRDFGALVSGNPYVGRGIVAGKSEDGKCAVAAYFIMGRSENSRNRVFVKEGGALFTRAFDESRVEDPSLIIYCAVRPAQHRLIVTNGDQTDTIYDALQKSKSFIKALEGRTFEPDKPNYTPRISAMLTFRNGDFSYEMSILKRADGNSLFCVRQHFSYPSVAGLGHFIHTYATDGDPLPAFCGEPERVKILNDPDEMTDCIWHNLDADNRISLYVRYTELVSGCVAERIVNRNEAE